MSNFEDLAHEAKDRVIDAMDSAMMARYIGPDKSERRRTILAGLHAALGAILDEAVRERDEFLAHNPRK
jgi:hypothetical protein